jgi:hypothetical protein
MITQIFSSIVNPWTVISYFGSACTDQTGVDCSSTGLPKPGDSSGNVDGTQLQEILTIAFGILAALSVLFIVIAGFRMVTAQGDSQQVSKARSTMVYAVVGLVVALLAEAFVAFLLDRLVA